MEKKSILRRDTLFVFYLSGIPTFSYASSSAEIKERCHPCQFPPYFHFLVIFLQIFPSQKHNNKIIFLPLQPIPLRAAKGKKEFLKKDSLSTKQKGKMPEWSNGADSKSAVRLCCT